MWSHPSILKPKPTHKSFNHNIFKGQYPDGVRICTKMMSVNMSMCMSIVTINPTYVRPRGRLVPGHAAPLIPVLVALGRSPEAILERMIK